MTDTKIQWTDKTWNPVRGCARVSPGCENCYAEKVAHRFSGEGQPYEGLTVLGKKGVRWAGAARFVPDMLSEPLKWRKPQRVFVNSMSDLFHDDVSDEQIAAVFAVMAACPQHKFQVLTKRPERMVAWFKWLRDDCGGSPNTADEWAALGQFELSDGSSEGETRAFWKLRGRVAGVDNKVAWPLPNVWLGVSCEDQKRADERIPLLLEVPAAVRFVSAEPLLGPIDLEKYLKPTLITREGERLQHPDPRAVSDGGTWQWGLNWVIVGGESGPGARPCDLDWIRSIVRQCARVATANCFVKQLGAKPCVVDVDEACGVEMFPTLRLKDRKGGDPSEWEADLRVREMP